MATLNKTTPVRVCEDAPGRGPDTSPRAPALPAEGPPGLHPLPGASSHKSDFLCNKKQNPCHTTNHGFLSYKIQIFNFKKTRR